MSYLRRIFKGNVASEEYYDEDSADKDGHAMHGCRNVRFFASERPAPY